MFAEAAAGSKQTSGWLSRCDLRRDEDTSTGDCVKQSVRRELITVRSPAARTASSLSSTLTLQEGKKTSKGDKQMCFSAANR